MRNGKPALNGTWPTWFAAASSASPRHRKQSATIGLTPTGPTLESAECRDLRPRPCHGVQVRRGLTEGNYTLDSRHIERLWRGPFVAGHFYLPLTTGTQFQRAFVCPLTVRQDYVTGVRF